MKKIYIIKNTINNKIYIGQTKLSLKKRLNIHFSDSKKSINLNRPLYKAIKEFGKENFFIELIEEVDDSIADDKEKFWINKFDSVNSGYNYSLGGSGNPLYDHQKVINLYLELKNCSLVAKELNMHKDTVTNILKENNIDILSSSELNKIKHSKTIGMYDKNNNLIKIFNSYNDAANFANPNNIRSGRIHISQVCNNKRKTAFGYIWKLL